MYVYVLMCTNISMHIYIYTHNFTKLWLHIILVQLFWILLLCDLFNFALKIWHAKWFKRKILFGLYYTSQTFPSNESFGLSIHLCMICIWWKGGWERREKEVSQITKNQERKMFYIHKIKRTPWHGKITFGSWSLKTHCCEVTVVASTEELIFSMLWMIFPFLGAFRPVLNPSGKTGFENKVLLCFK